MTGVATGHEIVSKEKWTEARKALLAKEKAFTRQRDELSARRRALPWVRVDKNYVFTTAAGSQTLGDLFDGRSQLIVYHFMFGPGWQEGCKSCSLLADQFDGMTVHLAQRDTKFVAVSRATLPEIEAFRKRMGWHFPWASSNGSDFNFDYQVSFAKDERVDGKVHYNYGVVAFPQDEGPGLSVFHKNNEGEVFHTYSTYARGLDILLGVYNYLDMTPKGRDEGGLLYGMEWVRHHDRYDEMPTSGACCHAEGNGK